tara:strand:+ start:1329 stop:1637 length:309 start_codon:yes stop_codon:yes gene_type:complete
MAENLKTANAFPYTKRITLGTAGNVTEIQLSGQPTKITFQFITNNGKIANEGTDGAAIGTDYFTVTAGSPFVYDLGVNYTGGSFYATAAVDSTVLEIGLERE